MTEKRQRPNRSPPLTYRLKIFADELKAKAAALPTWS